MPQAKPVAKTTVKTASQLPGKTTAVRKPALNSVRQKARSAAMGIFGASKGVSKAQPQPSVVEQTIRTVDNSYSHTFNDQFGSSNLVDGVSESLGYKKYRSSNSNALFKKLPSRMDKAVNIGRKGADTLAKGTGMKALDRWGDLTKDSLARKVNHSNFGQNLMTKSGLNKLNNSALGKAISKSDKLLASSSKLMSGARWVGRGAFVLSVAVGCLDIKDAYNKGVYKDWQGKEHEMASKAEAVTVQTGSVAGGLAGGWVGAKVGAALGSAVLPPLGTIVGGAIGGCFGYIIGSGMGARIAKNWVAGGKAVWNGMKKAGKVIANGAKKVWNAGKKVVGKVVDMHKKAFKNVANGVKKVAGAVKNVAKKAVNTVKNIVKKPIQAVKTVAKKALNTAKNVAKKLNPLNWF